MTNPNQENTLQSWATGKLALSLYGLAIGIFLHEAGVLQKLTSKFFNKKEDE